jgi:hypothetical protein
MGEAEGPASIKSEHTPGDLRTPAHETDNSTPPYIMQAQIIHLTIQNRTRMVEHSSLPFCPSLVQPALLPPASSTPPHTFKSERKDLADLGGDSA